jgi:hypothetical protein
MIHNTGYTILENAAALLTLKDTTSQISFRIQKFFSAISTAKVSST